MTANWEENTVNWVNQPGAGTPELAGPGGASDVNIDVSSIVQSWLTNPGSNHGFRLALQTETDPYRLRAFHTSEGEYPPRLQLTVENPEAGSDTLRAGFVEEGDLIRLEYESNYSVANTNSETSMNIGGETVSGRDISFEVEGPSCNTGTSEYVEFFTWVDETEAPDLQITMEFSEGREVWPMIPQGGAPSNFNFGQVDNTLDDIIITVTNNNEPLENHPVIITNEWIERSGGHYPDGSKSYIPQDLQGQLIKTNDQSVIQGTLETQTNQDGMIPLHYTASERSGKIIISAETEFNGITANVNDTIMIQVPDLVLLEGGSHYEKVGGTDNHYGPRLDGRYPNSRSPDTNHYGTHAFVSALEALSAKWHDLTTEEPSMDNRQTPLNINDISLPTGGLFDVLGGWNSPHSYHRVGRDVDIRTTRNLSVRSGILLSPVLVSGRTRYKNLRFEDLSKEIGANPKPKVHDEGGNNEHYHIYFY